MIEVLFFIIALFSEIIGTIAGFGSSTIFLPLALFFFEFKTALILVAILHFSGNIGRLAFFHKGINKKLLLTFGIPGVLFTIIGALLVNYTSQEFLKLILGLFLISFVFVSWKNGLRFNPTIKKSIVGGSLSGFFAGLIGTGGALRSTFLTAFNLEKSIYISTTAAISLMVDLTRIPLYLSSGFLPRNLFYFIPLLFLTAIIGSFIGKKIVDKIPQKKFRKLVLTVLFLASLKFLLEGHI